MWYFPTQQFEEVQPTTFPVSLTWKANRAYETTSSGTQRTTMPGITIARTGPSSSRSADVQGNVGPAIAAQGYHTLGVNNNVQITIQRH